MQLCASEPSTTGCSSPAASDEDHQIKHMPKTGTLHLIARGRRTHLSIHPVTSGVVKESSPRSFRSLALQPTGQAQAAMLSRVRRQVLEVDRQQEEAAAALILQSWHPCRGRAQALREL